MVFLKKIEVSNFRNYEKLDVELSPYINLIYGNNAQGKTNLLEAIYFLGLTKSHRINIDNGLIKNNEETAFIRGIVSNDSSDTKFEIGFNKNIKKIKIDDNQIKKISDYISKINIIIFFPEDLNLIKGSPKDRRRFLNVELSQIYPNYYDVLNDYNKLLKIRNNYLKQDKFDSGYFSILNEYLSNKACDIYIMRNKFIERINDYCSDIYKNVIKIEGFRLVYQPNIKIKSYVREELKEQIKKIYDENYELEKRVGSTIFGPHKDDFLFMIENNDLRTFGSQGQQRIAVLAVKLSEIKIFEKYKKEYPILLLDDVFSELDSKKKNNLLKYINKKCQVIITTTDLVNIDKKIVDNAKKIKIKEGKIAR